MVRVFAVTAKVRKLEYDEDFIANDVRITFLIQEEIEDSPYLSRDQAIAVATAAIECGEYYSVSVLDIREHAYTDDDDGYSFFGKKPLVARDGVEIAQATYSLSRLVYKNSNEANGIPF